MRDGVRPFDQPLDSPDRTTDMSRRPPHKAATTPINISTSDAPPIRGPPLLPVALYPGQRHPQTVHKPDIFFTDMNFTRHDPYYSQHSRAVSTPSVSQLYPSHQQQFFGVGTYTSQQVPTIPSPPPPPLPAKPDGLEEVRHEARHGPIHPALYRSYTSPQLPMNQQLSFSEPAVIPTSAYLGLHFQDDPNTFDSIPNSTSPTPLTTSPLPAATAEVPLTETTNRSDDGDELAVALALSKDESERQEEYLKDLAQQEDEELERALAASMLTAREGRNYFPMSESGAGPSNWESPIASSSSGPGTLATEAEAPSHSSSAGKSSPRTSQDDLALAEAGPSSKQKIIEADEADRKPTEKENERLNLLTHLDVVDALPLYSIDELEVTPTAEANPSIPIQSLSIPGTSVIEFDDDPEDNTTLAYLDTPSTPIQHNVSTAVDDITSPSSASILSPDLSYISEDEALARRIVAEEEEAYQNQQRNAKSSTDNSSGLSDNGLSRNTSVTSSVAVYGSDASPPTYAISIASTDEISLLSSVPEVRVDPAPSMPIPDLPPTDLSRNSSLDSSISVSSAPLPSTTLSLPFPSDGPRSVLLSPDEPQRVIGRVSSMSAITDALTSNQSRNNADNDSLTTPTSNQPFHQMTSATNLSAPNTPAAINAETSTGEQPYHVGILNANHFVDAELLLGVSIGFIPPMISVKPIPMQGAMPNIISLPFGRCPPLHLAGPSWRHLLKLMARLSSTRLEATVEALAINKNETLKLRTVIQFVKPHHMSQEWRTVFWFTIDHPIPPNMPGARTVPAMLKDASDSLLSKTYTIPESSAVPYPSLPITFPNLALYLQAALEDSRQQNESNAVRKLAKMVQICYPNDSVDIGNADGERSGKVSGLFKKVMGRGNKKDKKGRGRSGNEETYDLVTPFVPDEWG